MDEPKDNVKRQKVTADERKDSKTRPTFFCFKGCSVSARLIFYHGSCPDGVTALWAFLYSAIAAAPLDHTDFFAPVKSNNHICAGHELYALAAGTKPTEDLRQLFLDRDVAMLDVSFDMDFVKKIYPLVKRIQIMDHHKSAETEFQHLPDGNGWPKLETVIDTQLAACQIAWDWVSTKPRPVLLDYVADRDLWKFKLTDSREINQAMFQKRLWDPSKLREIHSMMMNITTKDQLKEMADSTRQGMAVLRAQTKRYVDAALLKTLKTPSGATYKVLLTGSHIEVVSDVGNELARSGECDFAMCWYYDIGTNRFGFSCRSDEDLHPEVDLSKICREFGGGGHKCAAGFSIDNVSQAGATSPIFTFLS